MKYKIQYKDMVDEAYPISPTFTFEIEDSSKNMLLKHLYRNIPFMLL